MLRAAGGLHHGHQPSQHQDISREIAKRLFSVKVFGSYRVISLRHEKCLRDHGMTESGMASRMNTDAGDMCVSIAGPAKSAGKHSGRCERVIDACAG